MTSISDSCATPTDATIIENMENLRTFWHWAWPPSWSNSPLWIVAFVGVVWFTISLNGRLATHTTYRAEAPAKQNGPQRPNFLPVDKTQTGGRVGRPVEGL